MSVVVGRLLLTWVSSRSGIGIPTADVWIADYGGVLAIVPTSAGRGCCGPFSASAGWSRASIPTWPGVTQPFRALRAPALLTPLVRPDPGAGDRDFPLLYRCWLRSTVPRALGRGTGWLALAWAVVPVIFVLGAEPFGSVLPFTMALASNLLLGFPDLPADLGMWPFGPAG